MNCRAWAPITLQLPEWVCGGWVSYIRGAWPDLFSEEGTATALDHIQVGVHLISTINGQI